MFVILKVININQKKSQILIGSFHCICVGYVQLITCYLSVTFQRRNAQINAMERFSEYDVARLLPVIDRPALEPPRPSRPHLLNSEQLVVTKEVSE